MIHDPENLARATAGQLLRSGPPGRICTDSRKISPGDWFLALSGENFDGHTFLGAARAAGCAGAIAARVPDDWDRGFLLVPDPLQALQDIARDRRLSYRGPVVGLTGSAGKTTTRAMIALVLEGLGTVHQTAGNLNNHVGLPLTLLEAPLNAGAWVLEMGMNHLGEIHLLQQLANPTVRLITNVGAAHTEGTGGIEGVAKAKGELFAGARPGDICIINADDPRVRQLPIPSGALVLTFGTSPACDVRLSQVHIEPEQFSTRLRLDTPAGVLHLRLPAPGLHLALNATAAVATGLALRLPLAPMAAALARYAPVGMRLRPESLTNGLRILNDAYNANPPSMRASLQTLAAFPGRRWALLGDMRELGAEAEAAHAEILDFARSLGLDGIGLSGPQFAQAAARAPLPTSPTPLFVAENPEALVAQLAPALHPDDLLLLKGSRGSAMERALPSLAALGLD